MNDTRRGRVRRPLKETPQYATLECLGRAISISATILAERRGLTHKTTLWHLRSLRAHGYVEMSRNKRKGAIYMLTEKGRQELKS